MGVKPAAEDTPSEFVTIVRAAGGVVVRRRSEGGIEVALIHRPAYDDWSFPKGKLMEGEDELDAAAREVEEETGITCRIDRELSVVRYVDRRGRPKTVRYWLMTPERSGVVSTKEVDEVRWLHTIDARHLLSYNRDRDLLRQAEAALAGEFFPDAVERPARTVYVVRHAKALERSDWNRPDHLRPLTKVGERQAEGMVDVLAPAHVDRIVSSPFVRCVQSVEPLAADRGLPVEHSPSLAEGAGGRRALALIRDASMGGAVLCTHGDVIHDVLRLLEKDGVGLDGEVKLQKGSTWVFGIQEDGSFSRTRYLPPPV